MPWQLPSSSQALPPWAAPPNPINADDLRNIFTPLRQSFRELEARVTELESRTFADVRQGTYQQGQDYRRGDIVTHAGAMWLALDDPSGKPPGNGWNLVVKKGRDAR